MKTYKDFRPTSYDHHIPVEDVAYIRSHRNDFEFHGWQDLLACVRGTYFGGDTVSMVG